MKVFAFVIMLFFSADAFSNARQKNVFDPLDDRYDRIYVGVVASSKIFGSKVYFDISVNEVYRWPEGKGGHNTIKLEKKDVFINRLSVGDKYLFFSSESNEHIGVVLKFDESLQGGSGDILIDINYFSSLPAPRLQGKTVHIVERDGDEIYGVYWLYYWSDLKEILNGVEKPL